MAVLKELVLMESDEEFIISRLDADPLNVVRFGEKTKLEETHVFNINYPTQDENSEQAIKRPIGIVALANLDRKRKLYGFARKIAEDIANKESYWLIDKTPYNAA